MNPPLRFLFPPAFFVCAVLGAAPSVVASADAEKSAVSELVAERERAALIDGLRDVIARRDAFFAESETLAENERSRRAADIAERFESLVERFPDSVPALWLFAEFLRDGGELSRAEKLLLRAEELAPDFVPARFLLGEIFAERGEPEKAFPRFEFAVRAAPENLEYHLAFGEFLTDSRAELLAEKIFPSRRELDAAAQDEFRAACAVAPRDLDVCVRYAESFYDAETPDWSTALAAWNAVSGLLDGNAVSAAPFLPTAVALHRARAFAELGRLGEAEKILNAAERVPALERSREAVFEIIEKKKANE